GLAAARLLALAVAGWAGRVVPATTRERHEYSHRLHRRGARELADHRLGGTRPGPSGTKHTVGRTDDRGERGRYAIRPARLEPLAGARGGGGGGRGGWRGGGLGGAARGGGGRFSRVGRGCQGGPRRGWVRD